MRAKCDNRAHNGTIIVALSGYKMFDTSFHA
jgi:hypothetical protein